MFENCIFEFRKTHYKYKSLWNRKKSILNTKEIAFFIVKATI